MRHSTAFLSIRTEGALFPADILAQIASKTFGGVTPEAYHLDGENLNEAISRSWNRLLGVWKSFQTARAALPPGDFGTTLTREKWLYKLFQELGYGRLQSTRPFEIDGKSYPVSHLWRNVPIHLVGCGVDIDKTHVSPGIIRHQPHGMVQEFLNRSDDHLFALLSNGLRLRLLRDNASLVRRAFVEFDLESMMDGESFPDFSLLWLLCHQSRVEADRPEEFPLERWVQEARKEGVQALDRLREGVEGAIVALGAGFLEHRANEELRDALRAGRLDRQDYYRSVLRLVYRLVFLFVAEERDLLCPVERGGEGAARRRQYLTRYLPHYSLTRIRRLAERHPGSRHDDLYRMTAFVLERLGNAGSDELGLSPLGSGLFDPDTSDPLLNSHLSNHAFLDAIRALTILSDEGHGRRPISYRNLGSEELGSVYEFLLELHPDLNLEAMTFALKSAAGNERKTTGSYYTPTSLIESLLKTALDPKLDEAARQPEPEKAILGLKVCDPACGSGHFLVAAAHRMAGRLGQIRCGGEPSESVFRQALRDVIGHCIYGVDINPMSVELCKVSLWMESMEPGKPLSFLDHRIVCGNSLLGTTPALMAQGVPDEAFQPLEGDERALVTTMRRQNRAERAGQWTLQFEGAVSATTNRLGEALRELDKIDDAGIEGVREKGERHRALLNSVDLLQAKESANAWCAAFVALRVAGAPQWTHDAFRRVSEGGLSALPSAYRESLLHLSEKYRFFHWHVAFPDVFRVAGAGEAGVRQNGWSGGFDIVVGNPPWEHTELKEKEWFAERRPDIANARTGAERKRMIEALKIEDPVLYASFTAAAREHDGVSHFLGSSGRYPFCGRGRINLYTVFAEGMRTLLNDTGRIGCVLPTGIATDDTTKYFFQDVVEKKSLVSLFDFENKGIFPDVDSRMKFCLFTSGSGMRPTAESAEFVFFAHSVEDLHDPERRFTLSAEDIALLNPNTRTCPIFRSRRDAELTKAISTRTPPLLKEGPPERNPWNIRIRRIFNMGLSEVSSLARTILQLSVLSQGGEKGGCDTAVGGGEFVPMLEGKMFDAFNHRAAGVMFNPLNIQRGAQAMDSTHSDLTDPSYTPRALYFFPRAELVDIDPSPFSGRWILGYKDISAVTNERSMIASILPFAATNFTIRVVQFLDTTEPRTCTLFVGCLNSFMFDYLLRQSLGGLHVSDYIVHQIPVVQPSSYAQMCTWPGNKHSIGDWLLPRVLELTYTAWDLESFAKDCGWSGPPFRYDEERRFLLRCELDAAFFHFYLPAEANGNWRPAKCETEEHLAQLKVSFPTPRHAAVYIMDTFPIVRRKDEVKYGTYRTKDTILEIYDAMTESLRSGQPYQTRLDPPPADPRCCHPARENCAP